MPQRFMIGTRIRERRVLGGIRQADLARRVGISPSYLNLIEHNHRRIGGKTLLRLAEVLDVEPVLLTEGAEASLLAGLREAAGAQSGDEPELDRIEVFARQFPGWAQMLVDLYRRGEALERTIGTLTDRLAHDPLLAASLHEVISAVTAIRATSSILVETEALEPEWQARFHRNINEDSARLTEGAQSLVRYLEAAPNRDAELKSPLDEMHAFLAAQGFHLTALEHDRAGPEDIERLLEQGMQEMAMSRAAQSLTRDVLQRYLADARVLPLPMFLARVRDLGLRPDRIAEATGVGIAQVFRRLASLPESEIGPVGLVICDGSGTLVFRKPLEGFVTPRVAGACPLWPLYQVLAQPQMPLRMRLRQAGRGAEVIEAFAVAAQAVPAAFDRPALMQAHMLLLPDPGAAAGPVRDLGVSCRICPLADCVARRESSIIAEGF
ncbi:MAG: transcriptional regulator [Rhodobacteraceae bacterium CG17_big_fil_post_rev_8_21_14_2_50_63_15]|nr:helix-turn-helix domain-containing protein [Roseovarius sp.]PIV79203.1 MAG: transcriptional regulator [Rhodobacteraceae bacterium CG17_big_fil_post_rev_8_21_14_2_50_63_15]